MDVLEQWSVYLQGPLAAGLVVTIATTLIATVMAILWAIIPTAARVSNRPLLVLPAKVYIEVFRGTPILVQMLLFFFGLSILRPFGYFIEPFEATVIVLMLNSGTYLAEIYRSGFIAIPTGQHEAAAAMGMAGVVRFRRVISPQALRVILPGIGNMTIAILLTTPIGALIGNQDLLFHAFRIQDRTHDWSVIVLIAIIYVMLGLILAGGNTLLERRLRLP
jgi:polar amino acid transport system permease protein